MLEYAAVEDSVQYTGRITMLVGGKPIGAVPRLAICQPLDADEVFLFYCDEWWNVLAAAAYPSLAVTRESAERAYSGISRKWVETHISIDEAKQFLRHETGAMACSFCGRLPYQAKRLYEGLDAWICDACLKRLHTVEAAESGPHDA